MKVDSEQQDSPTGLSKLQERGVAQKSSGRENTPRPTSPWRSSAKKIGNPKDKGREAHQSDRMTNGASLYKGG